jgi:hypothetical protein
MQEVGQLLTRVPPVLLKEDELVPSSRPEAGVSHKHLLGCSVFTASQVSACPSRHHPVDSGPYVNCA